MKSNKILQIVLVGLVVVFVAAAAYIYTANSSETKKQNQLKTTLNQSQVIYANGLAQKDALQTTAADLASQLADAKALLAQSSFRSSAESIEYDRTLYSLAGASKLNVTALTSGAPSSITDQGTTYKVTTFTVNVVGVVPAAIFGKSADDTTYINSVVNNINAYLQAIIADPDFNTAVIPTVNFSVPPPMSDADVQSLIANINSVVAGQQAAAIAALTAQIQTANAATLTPDQISALVKKATDDLVAQTIKNATSAELAMLITRAGVPAPTAVITINVWTY
jgi:hypothetical protein